ncbi:hypothetical protein LUZ60_015813 [Juncus effusus]|nr:hypothetical protein LUZ60_015813 [Juncus effusus]
MANTGQLHLEELPFCRPRSIDCFEKLERIGDGRYGQVYMAKETRTGEIVAIKKIRMRSERVPKAIVLEIKLFQKELKHPNVIQLKEIATSSRGPGNDRQEQGSPVDWSEYNGDIYMVFEYMDHDLAGLLARPGICFSVPQIKCYMRQLLAGLHYCHVNKLLHCDIKGSNILIDNEGNLKLADFSHWRAFPYDPREIITNNVNVITLWCRPPELLYGSTEYGPEVDMWAVGCVFAELLNGKPIFRGSDEWGHLNEIYSVCGTPDEENWPAVTTLSCYKRLKPAVTVARRLRQTFQHFDPLALDLLDKMLVLNPQERISAREALEADYFSTDPLPCDPKSLPRYEPSHQYRMRKNRRTNQHPVHHGPNEAPVHHGSNIKMLLHVITGTGPIVNYSRKEVDGAESGNDKNALDQNE